MTGSSVRAMREVDIVSEIIQEAGAIVLRHYESGAGADEYKDGEPVTVADRESDAFIVAALRRAFPDDEIVSEESLDDLPPISSPPADRRADPPSGEHAAPRVWYVDPMDGTSDFVKRTGDFVVMIGLSIAGWPVLGAVYHPPSGTLYRGGHGVAAEKRVDGTWSGMRVSKAETPADARLVVSRSHTPEVVADVAEQLGIDKMEKCGSVGLKAARVAEGAGELYLHPSVGTKLWDTCAPEAILVAAGGSLSDCDGRPLVYDRARLHNQRGLVASNGRLHDASVEALRGIW